MSAASAGAPGAANVYCVRGVCTFTGHGYPSAAWWSRPLRQHVCSMFARMPRYAPAASGIRSAAGMRAAGQNGSCRHVLAWFGSSSRRINEQSSGLLIRGFGVRVPGGAPVLTWHYIYFGWLRDGRFRCLSRLGRARGWCCLIGLYLYRSRSIPLPLGGSRDHCRCCHAA